MGKFLLSAALIIGLALTIGGRLFPDNVVMWFVSPDSAVGNWRLAVIAGIAVTLFVREFYDTVYWRLIWGAAAVLLAFTGFEYFLDNGQYVFDSLLFMMTAIGLAIIALQPSADPLEIPAGITYLQTRTAIAWQTATGSLRAGMRKMRPADRSSAWSRFNVRPPMSRGA